MEIKDIKPAIENLAKVCELYRGTLDEHKALIGSLECMRLLEKEYTELLASQTAKPLEIVK